MPASVSLASCGGTTTTTIKSIPEDMLDIQSNILLGLKDTASIDGYDTLLIPENVVYIEKEAFKDAFVEDTNSCSVKTVIFNKKLRGVASKAFEGCTNLTCLDFSNLTDIRLMSIIFEDGTVFANCSNESGAIKLPEGITDTQTEWVKTEFKNAGLPTSWFGDKDPQHKITTSTLVEKTGITADIETLTEKNEVNVTINNARSTSIVDANLTIQVSDQHVNVPFEGYLAPGANTVTYTKQSIQALFPSYTIQYNDAISFTLVRSGAYEVIDNQLYQFDDFGESNLISLQDLSTLSKKFLVKDQSSDDYVISDILYPQSENAFYDLFAKSKALDDDKSYDVYLIYGEYFAQNWDRSLTKTQFNLHGLVYGEEKPAVIRAYKNSDEGRVWDYGVQISEKIALTFENLTIKGSRDGEWEDGEGDFTRGLMGSNIQSFTDCYFSGAYTHWYSKTKFMNCVFDTTYSWKEGGEGANYALWINKDAQAWVEGCTFKSGGKCIKWFPGLHSNLENVVYNTTFILDQSKIIEKTGKTPSLKGIINIGTSEIGTSTGNNLYYKTLKGETDKFPSIIQWSETQPATTIIAIHADDLPDPW